MQGGHGGAPPSRPLMQQTAVRHGRHIADEDVGEGWPAVVLVHGACGRRSHYAAQLARLAQQHRVLALALRGHGESAAPPDGFTLRDDAEDVLAVCEAAGLARSVLGGHRMPVALSAATRHPERVAGGALLEGARLYPEALRAHVVTSLLPALAGAGWVAAMPRSLVGRGIAPSDSGDLSGDLKARLLAAIATAPAHMAAHMAAPVGQDLMTRDVSPFLTGASPLLSVHARVPAELTRLQELRPAVLRGAVGGSGHWMMLDDAHGSRPGQCHA